MDINSMKALFIECIFRNEYEEETILSTATGFLIRRNERIYLVTNRHVVTGKDNFTGKLLDLEKAGRPNELKVYLYNEIFLEEDKIDWWANESYLPLYETIEIDEEKKLWMEHPIWKEKIDVIAMDITELCQRRCQALERVRKCRVDTALYEKELTILSKPKVTDEVWLLGYPYGYSSTASDGYFPVWSRGTIASEYEKKLCVPMDAIQKEMPYENIPAFLVDARTRKGQSGSPVIQKIGDITFLLGIYSGRTNPESDLGYVWKTQLIEEIIAQAKASRETRI